MHHVILGIIFWLCFSAVIGCLVGLYSVDAKNQTLVKILFGIVGVVGLFGIYFVPNIVYNSARAEYVHNGMLVEMYQEELGKLDEGISEVRKLNPEAIFLSNQDTPIATTMELRAEMIRSLTLAKKKAYNSRVAMSQIENSIFSYAANKLKEEE